MILSGILQLVVAIVSWTIGLIVNEIADNFLWVPFWAITTGIIGLWIIHPFL